MSKAAIKKDLRFKSYEFSKFNIFQKVTVVTGSSRRVTGSHYHSENTLLENVWRTRFLPENKRFPRFIKINFLENVPGTRFLPGSNQFSRLIKINLLKFVCGTRFLPEGNRFL